MNERNLKRYAAKLLFQYRVVVSGDSGKRRICEERTVVFTAASPDAALATAKRKGKAAQPRNWINEDGNPVFFEFVGVSGLLCLDSVCEPDEVWYEIRTIVTPMERRTTLLPADDALLESAQ